MLAKDDPDQTDMKAPDDLVEFLNGFGSLRHRRWELLFYFKESPADLEYAYAELWDIATELAAIFCPDAAFEVVMFAKHNSKWGIQNGSNRQLAGALLGQRPFRGRADVVIST